MAAEASKMLAATKLLPHPHHNILRSPKPNPICRLPLKCAPIRAGATTATATPAAVQKAAAQTRVDILSESLPFIQRFRGKIIVVKYGGAAMKSPELQASVINDLVLLSCVGLRPVLVHGGGPEINTWLRKVGVEPRFSNGLRITDAETMELAHRPPSPRHS